MDDEKINDGGQAFPSIRDVTNDQNWEHIEGMTLRDHFAGQAMKSQLQSLMIMAKEAIELGSVYQKKELVEEFFDNMLKNIPVESYKMADAMIKEKNNV